MEGENIIKEGGMNTASCSLALRPGKGDGPQHISLFLSYHFFLSFSFFFFSSLLLPSLLLFLLVSCLICFNSTVNPLTKFFLLFQLIKEWKYLELQSLSFNHLTLAFWHNKDSLLIFTLQAHQVPKLLWSTFHL